MRKNTFLLLLFIPFFSFSQEILTSPKRCGTDEVLKNFRLLHPKAETDEQFESWLSVRKQSARTMSSQTVVTLPVVFHIIHSGEAEGSGTNISQAQVRQQILQLNKDFANLSNSQYGVAANSNIQFALAQTDPSGNTLAQPGIDRMAYTAKGFTAPPYTVGYASASNNYLGNTIKPSTYWDPSRYINIWVLQLESGILGIATFPQGSTLSDMVYSESDQTAGIAVVPTCIGSIFMPGNGGCGTYTKGKTMTHEMGHFLGLRHIWGDASCGNDYCGDTPVHQTSNSGVPSHPKANSCGTPDEMFENYMDYSDDVALNTFTANQVTRMQTVLANSPRRNTLSTSNVGFVSVTGTNRIAFYDCGGTLAVSETGNTGTSSRYRDYSFTLNIEDKATDNASITITTSGTAISGINYQIMTPTINISAGDNYKNVVIRVFDNALVESNKTLQIGYTISGTGVQAGTVAQSMTITILDNDNITISNNTLTLLSQDFTAPSGWNSLASSGMPNKFVVSNGGDAGGSGNVAYVSNSTSAPYANTYNINSPGIAVLRSPLISTSGISNLQLSFKYKVWGELYNGTAFDYGLMTYSTPASPFTFNQVTATGTGPYVGATGIASGTPLINLPDQTFANSSFYLGWYWKNDDNTGSDPAFNVDDVVLTGTGTQVETTVSTSYGYDIPSGSGTNHVRSTNNRAIATITNLSSGLSSLTASVTESGTGQTAMNTSSGSFLRSQKVFQVKPSVANTSATYRMTLYFTPAELAVWGTNKLNLKVLKVKDGVLLNETINSNDAVLVTPLSATEDVTSGVISYTADFTNGFSQFMLVSSNAVLPVGIIAFEAQPSKNKIDLTWKTATETANKGFQIERSANGTNFTTIGWVNGQGSTNRETLYRFSDNFVQPNTNYYYRLNQFDFDNRSAFSGIRQARISEANLMVMLSPNPAKDDLKVFIAGMTKPVDISLVNARGQTIGKWTNANPNVPYSINVNGFARGYYTLVVQTPEGNITEPVIIQ